MLVTLKYSISDEKFSYHFDKETNGIFGPDNGFRVAAAISKFDGDEQSIEDEEIGIIRIIKKSWAGPLDSVVFTELPTRPCT